MEIKEVGSASDIGMRKSANEDSIGILTSFVNDDEKGAFVVADGVGGEAKGEVASAKAVEEVMKELSEFIFEVEYKVEKIDDSEKIKSKVDKAVQRANRSIVDYKGEIGKTTITMGVIIDGFLVVGNVGDSRTYIYNDGDLQQITRDHSLIRDWVDQGKLSKEDIETPKSPKAEKMAHIINRVVGKEKDLDVDIFYRPLYEGDQILLCCDGLPDMVKKGWISHWMRAAGDAQKACDGLIELANEKGGDDNISVVVVKVGDLPKKKDILEAETEHKEKIDDKEQERDNKKRSQSATQPKKQSVPDSKKK